MPAAFDVVVVGGGPAGAATAIALAQRGLAVAIVERRVAPWPRVGETLPPMVRIPLESLGVWERFRDDGHEQAVGNRSFWGMREAGDINFVASPYGGGWHIDRRRFEQMLLDAAVAGGVTLYPARQLERVSGGGGGSGTAPEMERETETEPKTPRWSLSIPEPVTARFLVDATGRASQVARICGVQRVSIDQLIGATMFLEPMRPAAARAAVADPHGAFTLIEATEDGWWYSAPLPGGRLVAAYMTDADIATRAAVRDTEGWLARAQRTEGTRARLAAYTVSDPPRIASANTSRLASVIGGSWLAVGDAAISFDPLSSQGIVTALECALAAAATIDAHLGGDGSALLAYAERITSVYRRYLVERAQFYGVERRWPRSTFWQRRQVHLEVMHHATVS